MLNKINDLIIKYKIYIKYLISGSAGAFVNLSCLYILTEFAGLHYLASAILAFFISLSVGFNLQKKWTFCSKEKKATRQALLYFFVTVSNLLINTVCLYILVDIFQVWYMLSQVLIYGFLSIFSFIVYRKFVFKPQSLEVDEGNKKILIATGIFPPDIGGPATYTETLLRELPKRGFDVRVITYADADKKLEIRNYQPEADPSWADNLEIIKISRNQNILFRYLKYFFQVNKLLSWSDIVYIQDPISAGIPVSLACKMRGKKYLMKIVGDYAWEQGQNKHGVKDNLDEFQKKKYGWKTALLRSLQRWTANGAEKIVTPSNYLKNIVQAWRISGGKIEVIYNSVRPAEAMKSKEELRRELGLSGNVIISSARLVPWKGFLLLIDLMPELLNINPEFTFLINGEGPDRKKLEDRIGELKLNKKIIMLGALPQKKLWEYMKASDFFVLNTAYEGLPHIVIEAMYLELPVITTYAGGNTEVVRPGDNGILVEYNNRDQIRNAILKLWKDTEVRQSIVDNALIGLDRFDVKRMVDSAADLLDKKTS